MIARRFRILVECVFVAMTLWTQLIVSVLPPAGGFSTEEVVAFYGLAMSGPFAFAILVWELKSPERYTRPFDALLKHVLVWLTLAPLGMGIYWLYDYFEGGYRDSLGCGIAVLLFTPLWFVAARARR